MPMHYFVGQSQTTCFCCSIQRDTGGLATVEVLIRFMKAKHINTKNLESVKYNDFGAFPNAIQIRFVSLIHLIQEELCKCTLNSSAQGNVLGLSLSLPKPDPPSAVALASLGSPWRLRVRSQRGREANRDVSLFVLTSSSGAGRT